MKYIREGEIVENILFYDIAIKKLYDSNTNKTF